MQTAKPQLVGTPLSHFTRKIRILFHELGVDYDFVRVTGVLATETAGYGDNPLLRVPTLIDGADTIIDSDHIARHVVGRHDRGDRLGVRSEQVADLNRLAVISGVMANEVVLILAARGGLTGLDGIVYFRKLRGAIDNGLAWLDRDVGSDVGRDVGSDVGRDVGSDAGRNAAHHPEPAPFDYRDIALVCMWQHIAHYKLVPDLDRHAHLAARVARFAARPSVAATAPEAALAEARAAGWQPA
ncbi:MAG TPA: glutathione S-transferase N-terminal domain-containing protein [Kofleriaceae bacterium]|jgi:glutathione S-transferase|nr:glutathione S-transferase N-terminal domain-containing protein [Kofleriaceae bacterium]